MDEIGLGGWLGNDAAREHLASDLLILIFLTLLKVFLASVILGSTKNNEITTGDNTLDSLILMKTWMSSHAFQGIRMSTFTALSKERTGLT